MTPISPSKFWSSIGLVLALLTIVGEALAPHVNWVVLGVALAVAGALVERATAPGESHRLQRPDNTLSHFELVEHPPYFDWRVDCPELVDRRLP